MSKRQQDASLGPLTRALIRAFRADRHDSEAARRASYASLEGWVSIVVNTALFVVKVVLGLLSGSIALLADAAHTFADSLTSVIVILSARLARRPPDEEHPFGHGRVEGIATVACAVLLGVAGIEFVKSSIERALSSEPLQGSWWLVGAVAATIPFKEWLARFARALGRATSNTTLEAEFWHHRSDVLATLVVLVGIVGGLYGVTWLDGVMGAAVGALLLKVAYDVARSAIDNLLGRAPSVEEIRELRERALTVDGVRGVHDIVVHDYGPVRFVSLHVETSNAESADRLHELAESVERRVGAGQHGSVCVHVDPVNRDHPAWPELHRLVTDVVERDRCAATFHDLRVVGAAKRYTVLFDVNVSPDCPHDELETKRRLRDAVLEGSEASHVVVEIEPKYSYHE